MTASMEQLVQAATDLAMQAENDQPPSEAVLACLKAIAATQDEQTRHELANQAAERARAAGRTLGEIGLEILRVAIFHLP